MRIAWDELKGPALDWATAQAIIKKTGAPAPHLAYSTDLSLIGFLLDLFEVTAQRCERRPSKAKRYREWWATTTIYYTGINERYVIGADGETLGVAVCRAIVAQQLAKRSATVDIPVELVNASFPDALPPSLQRARHFSALAQKVQVES